MLRSITQVVLVGWLATVFSSPLQAEPTQLHSPAASSTWQVLESENFQVCGIVSEEQIRGLLATCEATRGKLSARWLGDEKNGTWTPKCYIVLHPTAESYLREVGEGQMTAGSSLVEFTGEQLSTRRVDLRADHPDGYLGALAHELTHVVMADRFIQRQIPRWADEGMAVLADTQGKQDLHQADLDLARTNRATFRLLELLKLDDYPDASRQATFYGQSASLVRYLVAQGGEQAFVRFLSKAGEIGYDASLREIYQLASVVELEQQWSRHVATTAAAPRVHATPTASTQTPAPRARARSFVRGR